MNDNDIVKRDIEKYIGFENMPVIAYLTFSTRPFIIANDCRISNTTIEALFPLRSLLFIDAPSETDVKIFVALKIIEDLDSVMVIMNPRDPVENIVPNMLATGWLIKLTGGDSSDIEGIPVLDVDRKTVRMSDIPVGWSDLMEIIRSKLEQFGYKRKPVQAIRKLHLFLRRKARSLENKNPFSMKSHESLLLRDYLASRGKIVLSNWRIVDVNGLIGKFVETYLFRVTGSSSEEYINSLIDAVISFVKRELGDAPLHVISAVANRITLHYLRRYSRDLFEQYVYGGEVINVE